MMNIYMYTLVLANVRTRISHWSQQKVRVFVSEVSCGSDNRVHELEFTTKHSCAPVRGLSQDNHQSVLTPEPKI